MGDLTKHKKITNPKLSTKRKSREMDLAFEADFPYSYLGNSYRSSTAEKLRITFDMP
jgi:hypothetical protein